MDREHERLWWLALAAAIVFGAYGKYSIGILVAGLFIGLLATRERRILRGPWPIGALFLVVLGIFPNALWQAEHGWPFLEVLRGDALHRPGFQNGLLLESRDYFANAWSFAI